MAVAGQIYSTTPIRLTRKCITVRGIDSVWKATKTPRNAVINLRLNYRASQVKRLKESSRMWSRCSESEHNLRTTPRLQVLCFWFTPSSSLDKKPAGICAWCLHEASTALTHSLGSRGCSNKASLTWVAHVKKKKILAPSCWNYQVLEELRGDSHVQLIWNPLGCSWMLRTAKCLQIWRWGLIQWWILLWVLEKNRLVCPGVGTGAMVDMWGHCERCRLPSTTMPKLPTVLLCLEV